MGKNLKKKVTEKLSKTNKKTKKISDAKGNNWILKEALSDINKEISSLNKIKKELNTQIRSLDINMDNSRQIEKKLQEKIARLIEKEASLKEKSKKILQKQDKLADRLSKVQKIKFDLGEI